MSKKGFIILANQSLIIFLMIMFVISAVVPEFSLGIQTVNVEEADVDGQESSEEKKEHKEDKENFNQDGKSSFGTPLREASVIKRTDHSPMLQELYLPVITPPPDDRDDDC